jgi:hypothetical protein
VSPRTAATRERRDRLYKALIPRLYKGAYIPMATTLGRSLGVSTSTAHYDLRWVLRHAGIATRLVRIPEGGTRVRVEG